ncbi:hypothetical protein HYH02_007666 [Chlamydomonas schloesseri]|uniref:phytol kinase n=1 Tax=Chlamydomonas schloesseri TaxID=2026947 RepID=A0A836B4G7_9CHLO|nr:hypothetical protein HYH02_007666 [Chlamydomonas schloesseri]|eukprot:KAG2447337.1 hypothetical protein HYH02_007666 [Chlamydomonas schloesseri]
MAPRSASRTAARGRGRGGEGAAQPAAAPEPAARGAPAPEEARNDGPLGCIREIAGCAEAMAKMDKTAELPPRVGRIFNKHKDVLMSSLLPPIMEAWSTAWSDPALRVPLLQVFNACVRRLELLVAMEDAADSFLACLACFGGFCFGLGTMMAGHMVPAVATATRVKTAKLAVDTQLLHALARLLAAGAAAEAAEARRVAARPSNPAFAGYYVDPTPIAAMLAQCSTIIVGFVEGAIGPDVAALRAVGLHDAIAESGVLSWMARNAVTRLRVAADLDAALTAGAAGAGAAAAAGRAGGSGGSSVRGEVRVHRNGMAKQARSSVSFLCELWFKASMAAKLAAAQQSGSAASAAAAAAYVPPYAGWLVPHIAWLELVLSGGCVQHLMLQHLVAQVAAADGGGGYGLAPQVALPAQLTDQDEAAAATLQAKWHDYPCDGWVGTSRPGAGAQFLFVDTIFRVLDMWTMGRPPPPPPLQPPLAAAPAGAAGGGAAVASASGSEPQWPPGAPWQARNIFTLLGSGGHSGLLQRPGVPLRGMQGLLRRLVEVCLASLVPGLRRHQQQRGGSAAAAQLYTLATTQPTATGKAFPARGSLVCASRAVLLAFSNRCLKAQERQRLWLQKQQQQQQQGGAAPAVCTVDPEPHGDIRALWRPLVRVAHACVDAAVVTGMDLGECGYGHIGSSEDADADTKPAMYNEAVESLRVIERLMSPCGGLQLPRLPPRHGGLFTLLPEPPLCLAMPLGAGYVPALERLLRAMYRTQGSKRDGCLKSVGGLGLFASHFRSFEPAWAGVFAYGQPMEVASLIATSAMILRNRLMAAVEGVADMATDPQPGEAEVALASLKLALPGEMAMRRRLIRGPNLLQGMLAWLADSVAPPSGGGPQAGAAAAAAAPSGWAAADGAAAGLVPGGLWWQRRWRHAMAAPGNSNDGGGGAAAFDWGVPQPALQSLALCSFTLKHWFCLLARSSRNLLIYAVRSVEIGKGITHMPSVLPTRANKACCCMPKDAASQHNDDLHHVGVQTRTALGAACTVFQATVLIVHAHLQCKEFAEAARRLAASSADAAAAQAAAAAADAAAEAWKQLLIDPQQGHMLSYMQIAVELIAVGPPQDVKPEHAAWASCALMYLTAAFPAEAAAALFSAPITMPTEAGDEDLGLPPGMIFKVPVDTALRSRYYKLVPAGKSEAARLCFGMVARVLAGAGIEAKDLEMLKAGFPAITGCTVGQHTDALWARRVAALLPPLALAGELVGMTTDMCSNTGCVAMVGDSAAGVVLKRCSGRCGGVASYCCVECQRAHWNGGHKEVCGKN